VPRPRAVDHRRLLALRRALLTGLGVDADRPADPPGDSAVPAPAAADPEEIR
jgi:hypothetical protein